MPNISFYDDPSKATKDMATNASKIEYEANLSALNSDLDKLYNAYDEDFASLLNFKSELASLKSGTMTLDEQTAFLEVIESGDDIKGGSSENEPVVTSNSNDFNLFAPNPKVLSPEQMENFKKRGFKVY